jgi:CBS domain containing-hemolysin-like protein
MVSLAILIITMLLLSAFFSGSEIAFVSANKLGIEVLKNKGTRRGNIIARFYDKPREFLSSMLVGNNISLVLLTMFASQLIDPLLSPIFGENTITLLLSVTLIITIIVLILGEFIPKTLFRLFSNELLYKLAFPIRFFIWLLAIPTWFMTSTSNLFLKYILKAPEEDVATVLSRVDLEEFINDKISEEEDIDKEILTNALNLGQLKVRDCMIPRNEIISADINDSIPILVDQFKKEKISRIIVSDGDLENTKGYIHHQQLFLTPASIKKILLPIKFVPDAMGLKDLLFRFIKDRTNIACVVDEFGGLTGLITLEDILEEIFGEIEDEHDNPTLFEAKLSAKEYLFAGRHEIDYLNEKYPNLDLPEGDYHTLSGLIVTSEENIPEEGDEIIIDEFRFVLESVSDTKIETVRIFKDSEKDTI